MGKAIEIGIPLGQKAQAFLREAASLSGDPLVLSEEDARRYLLKELIRANCIRLEGPCGDTVEITDETCVKNGTKSLLENGPEKYIEKYLKWDAERKQKLWQEAKRFVEQATELLKKGDVQREFPEGCRK